MLALATLVFGWCTLFYPFGIDQLLYAFFGDAVLHGKVLYRDIPMMQMPLTGLVHTLALVLFGRTMTSIRIMDLLWTFATAGLVYLFTWQAFGRRWLAISAGALYSFFYYLNNYWFTAQPDGFLNLPLAGAFCLLLPRLGFATSMPNVQTQSRTTSISCSLRGAWVGILVGVALLFKYPIITVAPCLALAVLLAQGWGARRAWSTMLAVGAGGLLVVGAFIAAIAALGGWPEFIRFQTGILPAYSQAGNSELSPLPKLLLMFRTLLEPAEFRPAVWFGLPGLVAGIVMLFRLPHGTTRRAIGIVLLWLLAAFGSVYGQGKMIYYHYLPMLPPIAVLSALLIARALRPVWHRVRRPPHRVGLLVASGMLLLVLTPYRNKAVDLWPVLTGRLSLRAYWQSDRFVRGDYSVAEVLALSDYVRDNTQPGDRVANFALDPQSSFPIWREPVMLFSSVLSQDPSTLRLDPGLKTNPPNLFVVKHNDRIPLVRGHSMTSFEQLLAATELRQFVADNYEYETHIGQSDVLRRADSDHELPSIASSREQLDQDLDEALDFVVQFDSSAYRTILWPLAPPAATAARFPFDRTTSQRAFNRVLWLRERALPDYLPILSVWVKGDSRPFGRQPPFTYQNEGDHFIADGLRFTRLHACRQGLVLVYLIARATGAEPIKPSE